MKTNYSFKQAVEYSRIPATAMTELLISGSMPAVKIGSEWIICQDDIDGYVSEQVQAQTAARREAYLSGRPVKIPTAATAVRLQKGKYPALQALPA